MKILPVSHRIFREGKKSEGKQYSGRGAVMKKPQLVARSMG